MNYIINPIWFYLMNLSYRLSLVLLVLATLCGLGIVYYVMEFRDVRDKEKETTAIRRRNKLEVAVVVIVLIFVALPSRDTCKAMIAASLVTKENLSYTKEEAKELVDYIFEKIEEVQDEDSD